MRALPDGAAPQLIGRIDERLKVAIVSQPIGDVVAGDDSVNLIARAHARGLADECDVVVCGAGEPGERELDGVRYRSFGLEPDARFRATIPGRAIRKARSRRRPQASSPWWAPRFWREIAATLAVERPDVVHVHNFSQFLPFAARAVPDAAVVLQMHCTWLEYFSAPMLRRRLALADAVLGVSDYVTSRAADRFPRYADRFHTLYNGVDVARFEAPARRSTGPVRLLSVGRISPEKGLHVLVEAFELLLARGADVELTIVGALQLAPPETVKFDRDPAVRALESLMTLDYEDSLRRALAPAARSRVAFAGAVPHAEIPARYAAADLLVQPSLDPEPFGVPVVEAMASGIPVVTTAVGGPAEVIEPGTSGLLVRGGDASALADAIGRLAGDRDMRETMGAAARRRAADFSWDAVTARLLERYRVSRGARGRTRT